MIPYVPEPFIDRSVQYPGRRYITRPDSTVELCQISRSHEGQNAEGAIYAEGTPLNAQSFNDEMTKVKDTFDSIDTDLQAKQPALTAGSGILIQNNVISATGGSGTAAYLAGLADVGLYAPASGEVLLFDGSQGKWINGDIVTGKKSGAVVAFGDGAGDLPIKDLNVEIKATQSGSGDPSPSNARPISGRSEINVARCAVNVWNEQREQGGIGQNTGADTSTAGYYRSIYIPVKAGFTYYLKTPIRMMGFYYDANKTFLSRFEILANGGTFTTPTDTAFIRFRNTNANEWDTYGNDVSVNHPSTDTAYHAYMGTTVTIALGQTVYGGELDVTSGVLTVTHVLDTFSNLNIIRASNGSFYANIETKKLTNEGLTCSCFKVYNGENVNGTTILNKNDNSIGQNSTSNRIYIRADSYTTEQEFQTALGSESIVYELATPVTVQLTPTEIKTLQGNNTIFADSGEILNLEYYRDEAKKIIDLFQFDESLKAWTAENFAPLYTDVTGTLLAGETYLILNSPKIFTTSTIDIYTDTFGVAPYAIEVQNGNVRLTFVARASDLNVKVRIT